MRITVITACYPPIAAAEADYAHRFCHEIASLGIKVDVLTSKSGTLAESGEVETHPTAHSWGWLDLPALLFRLYSLRPDTVVMLYLGWPYGQGHPMATFLPGLVKTWNRHQPFVTLFFNRYGAERSRGSRSTILWQRIFEKLFARHSVVYEYGTTVTHSDHVFVLSEDQRRWMLSVYPKNEDRIEVLPSLPLLKCSDLSEKNARRWLAQKGGWTDGGPVLGYLGYLYPGKGVEVLFRALARCAEDVKLVLIGGISASAGSEYAEQLRALARSLGIGERILWYGPYEWNSEEPSRLLRGVDAIVLPFDDGIALNNSSVATACWHTKPIVSTRRDPLEPAFRHGENVWLVPPKDPEVLARGIERLVRDNELKAHLAKGAIELAEQYFSWSRAGARWRRLFRELLGRTTSLSEICETL